MDESEHASSPGTGEDTAEQPPAGASLLVEPSGHSELSDLQRELGVPVSSGPPAEDAWSSSGSLADDAWSFGAPSEQKPSLPPMKRPVALLVVVALVAAAGAYFFINRKSSSDGTALALSLARDASYSYDVHLEMGGTITAQGQKVPFNMQLDQTIGWQVQSVDADGTATVIVSTRTGSARINGQLGPAIPSQTATIRVAKDGRMLSAGLQLRGFDNGDFSSLVPGSDQFMPVLPDHPVRVGDSWTKRFDQDLPFGMGRLHYAVDSNLLRYETVDGAQMAVIQSNLRLPLNMSIELRKVLGASGDQAARLIPKGTNPTMKFGGFLTMDQTAWFDQRQGELSKSSANARFDMSIAFTDFPAGASPPGGPMLFAGTMNLQVLRRDTPPKLSRKEADAKAQSDLRAALAAAKVLFADTHTYRGFTPVMANRIEPSLPFTTALKARVGRVGIRVATKAAVLLVTRSASGKVFCIADRSGRVTYGSVDARRVSGCRGGW
jgi:hypothetical protein